MILAPGCGMPPMVSMVVGTWSSHRSSCLLRVGPSSEYHDPAWLAGRCVMVRVDSWSTMGGWVGVLSQLLNSTSPLLRPWWGLWCGLWRGRVSEETPKLSMEFAYSLDAGYEYESK